MPQRTLSGQSEASRENSGPPQASLPSSRRKEAKTKQKKTTIIPPNWCSIQHHLRAKKLINPLAWLLPSRAHTPYSFSALSPVEEQCPRRRGPPPERSSASPEYEVGVTVASVASRWRVAVIRRERAARRGLAIEASERGWDFKRGRLLL